jgi:hypothetical protein
MSEGLIIVQLRLVFNKLSMLLIFIYAYTNKKNT